MASQAWYRQPEMIVALSAVVLSIFTVGIGAYSAWIDRAYARAAVWPRLEMGQTYGAQQFGYFVSNRGTGPALVRSVQLTVDGVAMRDWAAVFDALGAKERQYLQSQISARTISPGQDIQVLQTENAELIRLLGEQYGPAMAVSICYCSIYEECWTVNQSNQPRAVDRCELASDQRFLQ